MSDFEWNIGLIKMSQAFPGVECVYVPLVLCMPRTAGSSVWQENRGSDRWESPPAAAPADSAHFHHEFDGTRPAGQRNSY